MTAVNFRMQTPQFCKKRLVEKYGAEKSPQKSLPLPPADYQRNHSSPPVLLEEDGEGTHMVSPNGRVLGLVYRMIWKNPRVVALQAAGYQFQMPNISTKKVLHFFY